MDDSVIDRYHKQKIEEEITDGIKHIQEVIHNGLRHNHGKVIKTIPMKPEWKARYEVLDKFSDEIEERGRLLLREMRKMEQLGHYFWAAVSVDLDSYGDMHVNKNNEIEMFEDSMDTDRKGNKINK